MQKLLISFVVVMALLGCSSTPSIKVSEVEKTPPPNIPIPSVKPTTLKSIEWAVSDSGGNYTYSLSQSEFESLVYNLQDLRRYILDQKSVIEYLIPFVNRNEQPLPDSGNQPNSNPGRN